MRRSLRFSEQAQKYFSFLVESWGFRLVRDVSTLVRFENRQVYLQVFHGRVSFEVGLELGLLEDPPDVNFDLSALVEISEPTVGKAYRRPAVREEAALGRALQATAELFRTYGRSVVTGDPSVFAQLREVNEARVHALAIGSVAAQARPRAERAFKSADYQTVVDAYSAIEEVLTPVERRKLAYARKKT